MARNHPTSVFPIGVFSSVFSSHRILTTMRPTDCVPKKFPGGCNDHLHQWLGDFPDIVMVHAANANRTHGENLTFQGFSGRILGWKYQWLGHEAQFQWFLRLCPCWAIDKYWACNTNLWKLSPLLKIICHCKNDCKSIWQCAFQIPNANSQKTKILHRFTKMHGIRNLHEKNHPKNHRLWIGKNISFFRLVLPSVAFLANWKNIQTAPASTTTLLKSINTRLGRQKSL